MSVWQTILTSRGVDAMGPRYEERFLVTVTLAICVSLCATVTSAAQEKMYSGWYVGAALGINRTSGLRQVGWNRDNVCYPMDDCTHVDGALQGYRWAYDLAADDGAAFEISFGRAFDALRLELSFTQRRNSLDQEFTGISYLDGTPRVRAEVSNYDSRSSAGVDELTTRTLSLSAYYDFSRPGNRFTPYLGLGTGVSFAKLSGLYFQSWYSCEDPAAGCDRPERYNSHKDEDPSDTVLSAHLHTGLDYHLNDKTLIGLKVSYAMVENMEDVKGDYIQHPVPGISNFTTISGMNHWSVLLGVKYFFGN